MDTRDDGCRDRVPVVASIAGYFWLDREDIVVEAKRSPQSTEFYRDLLTRPESYAGFDYDIINKGPKPAFIRDIEPTELFVQLGAAREVPSGGYIRIQRRVKVNGWRRSRLYGSPIKITTAKDVYGPFGDLDEDMKEVVDFLKIQGEDTHSIPRRAATSQAASNAP